MAILTFVIGALLFAAGAGGFAMSVDLVPTEMGRLYAESGVIFVSASGVVWAIAALIARLNRIVAPSRSAKTPDPEVSRESEPAAVAAPPEPQGEPHIIGRYNAGEAKYLIFSDGAIEAETAEGGLRFASMNEFKAYVASRKS